MDSRDMMLRKEWDGKGYYERCGAEARVAGLSSIFRMLSEDEVRHAEALRALQSGARVELPYSATLDGAKSILRRLSVQAQPVSPCQGDLRHAMQFEASSARECGQMARQALHGWERELFLRMAAEDEMHFTLLEQMQELFEPAAVDEAGDCEDVDDAD
ncbi:MAG TPA: ferritin [Geobacter sp.]|nr:ferritin [Geobacter sp.]